MRQNLQIRPKRWTSHHMSQLAEFLVEAFGEHDDADWERVRTEALTQHSEWLKGYPAQPLAGQVAVRNIGLGADWSVIAITVGALTFGIPEAHKRVRENLEEWKRIWEELKKLSALISRKARVIHPDHYLFLVALFDVAMVVPLEAVTFVDVKPLPEEDPDLQQFPPLLFSFLNGAIVYQVAVSRRTEVLWRNQIPVS